MADAAEYKVVPDVPDDLLQVYLTQPDIAVDTELQGLRLGRDNVCLVQICDRASNVCLVRPDSREAPPNLYRLLTAPEVTKVFHFALTDIAFLRVSMGIDVTPYRCTKVMSKLIRTYSESHGLKDLVREFKGLDLDKAGQTTNWNRPELTQEQLRYAAHDVLHLLSVFDHLQEMFEQRGTLPSGITAAELNERSQAHLPTLVELIVNGYGDRDSGWETSVFNH